MKRNRFGINLDEGIPLSTPVDFELLHVNCFSEIARKLLSWIEGDDKSLLLGGQIGSGKSTLIEKAILEASMKPDIVLHFDREVLNLDAGDFWGITLAEFIKEALNRGVDLSFCKLPQELGGYQPDQWDMLYSGLRPNEFSMNSFATKIVLRKKIAENTVYIGEVIGEIGRRLKSTLGRAVFIYASGLDKFDPASSAFFAAREVVSALSGFKTLYEVNAVHLFSRPGSTFNLAERLFIPVAKPEAVVEMLSKRMGIYAKSIPEEIEVLAKWSGGNPRQAIRLLTHFDTARKNRKWINAECIAVAIHETTRDFFAFSPKPSNDLIRTIQRSGKIESSLFYLPIDRDTARLALYGNWIFIDGMGEDVSLAAKINPLVKAAFDKSVIPEEPEVKLLKEYAAKADISAIGLSIHRVDESMCQEKSGEQLLWDVITSGVERPIHTNLDEIFDVLRAALLSKDRADRVIIAYKDSNVTKAARAYLFAKANTYEYQRYLHFNFEGGAGKQPLEKLEEILSKDTDIISLEFSGEWEKSQLEALDKQRDRFMEHQMLWWIPYVELNKYLPHWVQLRQLFEVFILEDELLGSISTEEVEADLAFFEELVENEESAQANVVTNLKSVLEYLKRVREGENHG